MRTSVQPRTGRIAPNLAWAALAVAMLGAQSARANQAFTTDCFFDFKNFFGANETVCVSGDVDSIESPAFLPDAKICVTTNQVWAVGAGIADVSAGGCNLVVGASLGGGFFDEPVWQPPLVPGRYDVIVDENENGVFDAADYAAGAGTDYEFQVGAPVANPVDLSDLKAQAEPQFREWDRLAKNWHWLGKSATAIGIGFALASGDVVSAAVGTVSLGLSFVNVDFPTDYNAAVITVGEKIIVGLAQQQATHYEDLWKDPPDPNFTVLVPLDLAAVNADFAALEPVLPGIASAYQYPFTVQTGSPADEAQVTLQNLLAEQAALVTALTRTYEKYQGAEAANDDEWSVAQARMLGRYAGQLTQNLSDTRAALLAYETLADAEGTADIGYSAADIALLQSRLATSGLTPGEEAELRAGGFTDADLAALIERMQRLPAVTGLPDADFTRRAGLQALVARVDETLPAVQDAAADAQALVTGLGSFVVQRQPTANAGGPYAGVQGSPISLSGAGSSTPGGGTLGYAWDLDLDGQFDDATGAAIQHTFDAAFAGQVGLRVTNAAGFADVDYAPIAVSAANRPPVITGFAPAATSVLASATSAVDFSVTANDPDGDPLAVTWTLDGSVVSTANAWQYVPSVGASGAHIVKVSVSDGNPASPDALQTWVVTIEADTDGDGVGDSSDNCTLVANPDQRDTNGDGYGNLCDADLDNSGVVSAADYLLLRARLNTADPDADLNGDGVVSAADYLILRARLNQPPGPSAVAP
jgi:hypothetical protein